MTLDVETPEIPPVEPLRNGTVAGEELAAVLDEGAWRDGFQEWAADTYLAASEFRQARELGLFERFGFYVEPEGGTVGYDTPPVPRGAFDDGDGVREELDALGRAVSGAADQYLADEEFGFFADTSPE